MVSSSCYSAVTFPIPGQSLWCRQEHLPSLTADFVSLMEGFGFWIKLETWAGLFGGFI